MANTSASMILRVPIGRAAMGRTARLSSGGNRPHILELASSIHSPYASWLDRFGDLMELPPRDVAHAAPNRHHQVLFTLHNQVDCFK